jgi:toxin ParE1/3/4
MSKNFSPRRTAVTPNGAMADLSLIRTSTADRDLFEIWVFVAKNDLTAADRLIRRLDDRFRQLTSQPKLGELVRDEPVSLRRTIVSPYLIFYQVCDDSVRIVRVLHSARNWEELL